MMQLKISSLIATAIAVAACSSSPSPGASGGAGGTTSASSSSTTTGSGGAPSAPWDGGFLGECTGVQLVALAPGEDHALAVQKVVPPPGERFIDSYEITFVRSPSTGGPYKAAWAVGTAAGIPDMPAIFGERVVQEADLSFMPSGTGIEIALATITFDEPIKLEQGDVFYAGMRLERHDPNPSEAVLCETSDPAFDPALGQASLYSHALAGGGVSQCPGDCRLDKLSAFGLPYPMLLAVHGH